MSSAAGSLAQDMLSAFRDQQLSDITVVAFDQTFHLHRLILLRSGYFRSLILGEGDWIEKTRQAITMQFDDPYVTLESFQRIIHWLYGIDFHYSEGSAPITFRTSKVIGSHPGLTREGLSASGRHGLGLQHGHAHDQGGSGSSHDHGSASAVAPRRYDNIMLDPSDKIDELLISMYAAASYLNITALMEEICSDIAHRIRESRGLIHYMEYAWKLNNGKAWDIILAQCFYQFFWSTYRSPTLQDMLSSPDMPLAGLVKCLVSESLWVPNEYERYQLVKGVMLRRLSLETEKLMDWVYDYHDQDWFMILKDLDDNGTWSYEFTSDQFLNSILDWEATSTEQYEDAMDTDHDWATTTKELRRRNSSASNLRYEEDRLVTTMSLFEEDRAATPTATAPVPLATALQSKQGLQNMADFEEGIQGIETDNADKKTSPPSPSPSFDSPVSSPNMSVLSLSIETLPRHQVRELLTFMYILHHSIHYTHMSFDHLHQILTDGLVLPARIKDAFWRQHLLRRIAVSTSPSLPYLTAPSAPLHGRYHGAGAAHRERRTPMASAISRAKMSGSTRTSPSPAKCLTINSHGLLPIRFSTSLYISRRDLLTDGKHFTSSTFYGGSWWSIQVGNNLNSRGVVGVFLSAAPVPRVVPSAKGHNSGGLTLGGGSGPRSGSMPVFGSAQQSGSTLGGSNAPLHRPPQNYRHNVPASSEGVGNGDCSSVYSRQRELTCSYRIYMTSNVVEAPEYFAATAAGRLEEIRGSEYGHGSGHPSNSFNNNSKHSNHSDAFQPRATSSNSMPTSPEMVSGTFGRSSQKIAAEDEMICEDLFKLNEGWGYSKSIYLTRVARHVRDNPPKTNAGLSNVYPQDTTHGAQTQARAPAPPQHQQQQQAQGQHPVPVLQPLGAAAAAMAQQVPPAQLPGQPPQAHPHPQAQNQAGVPQLQQQQQPPLPGSAQPAVGAGTHASQAQHSQASSTPHQGVVVGETEDDGLWIHFVVKVGWSDRKGNGEKAVAGGV